MDAPVSVCGDIALVQGADYYAADGLALLWTDATWPDLVGATVTLKFKSSRSNEVSVSFGCVVVDALHVKLELSAAQTATIPYSRSGIPDSYELWAVLASEHNVRLKQGVALVES